MCIRDRVNNMHRVTKIEKFKASQILFSNNKYISLVKQTDNRPNLYFAIITLCHSMINITNTVKMIGVLPVGNAKKAFIQIKAF